MKTAAQYESELKEFFKKLEEKAELKARVFLEEFIYEATNDLIDLTPLGDSSQYEQFYRERQNRLGLKPEAGLAANNYQISFNSAPTDFLRVYSEGSKGVEFLNQIQKIKNSFSLGDSIYVVNNTPYLYDISIRGTRFQEQHDPEDWLKATVQNQSAVEGYFLAASAASNRVNYTF